MSKKEEARQACIKTWNELFSDIDKVWITTRSVSNSGMSRKLSVYVILGNNLQDVTNLVSGITGMKMTKEWELVVNGCGMDMHFHVAHTLSMELGKSLDKRSF